MTTIPAKPSTAAVEAILKAELLTVPQVSTLMRVEEQTIRNWIKENRIPYLRLPKENGQGWLRVPKQALLSTLILHMPENGTEKVQ